jgi:hypothetical protein
MSGRIKIDISLLIHHPYRFILNHWLKMFFRSTIIVLTLFKAILFQNIIQLPLCVILVTKNRPIKIDRLVY